MRSIQLLAIVMGLALATGCSATTTDDAASDADEVKGGYVSPGKELGRTTHVIADVDGTATFTVYDRALERRAADGSVQAISKVDAGYQGFVVSKNLAALLSSTFVNGSGEKTTLHVFSRKDAWKEIRTEDLSTTKSIYHHPIAMLDDDTIAVGSGEDLLVLEADGTRRKLGGYASKFRADEISRLYPTGSKAHVLVGLDNGETYDVDVAANTLAPLAKLENAGAFLRNVFFDAPSKRWVTTDFDGVKVWGLDGKLLQKADLVTAKGRTIGAAALVGDKLLVANDSERSQERSVLATYDLDTLTRKEIGTLDGSVGELSPAGDQLFFSFSPSGAEGFNSRVYYAHVRKL